MSIASIGSQETGKSHFHIQLLKLAFKYNLFQKYHLILPVFNNEQNGSYNFIPKGNTNIKVYNKYHTMICDFVTKDAMTNDTFLFIDDCTGEIGQLSTDDTFKKLYTRIRHHGGNKLYIGLCMHYTKIIPPVIRANAKFFVLHFMTNYKTIEDFYDENIRILYEVKGRTKKNYIEDYEKYVMGNKYGAVMIGKINNIYRMVTSFNSWKILKFSESNGESVKLTYA